MAFGAWVRWAGTMAAAAVTLPSASEAAGIAVHPSVVQRGEPFPASPELSGAGSPESLARAVFRARAPAIVAVNAPDGQGTGTLLRPDGWILTCQHVVGPVTEVQVALHGGILREARVVAADPILDLALLKVETDEPLPWIAIADLAEIEVGDPVVSIGHPKGFGWTVNSGIVSNLFAFRNGRRDPGVIQSQVPLNPGNSGGPLLDARGRLVGVIAQGDPGAQSLNWSISARAVKDFLVRHAHVLAPSALTVTATPPGAEILLDGVPIGAAPRATARVGAGTHVVEVRKEGFGSVLAPFLALQREAIALDVRLAPAGTLAVTADTHGVDVYVDGVFRGHTPLSIEIAAGPHVVEGSKPGTADTRAPVTVRAEAETEVALSHPPNTAYLSVVSVPEGAEVVVDGTSFGETPVETHALPPGQHVVDVRSGDLARRVVVEVAPAVHRRLEFDLRPPSAAATPAAVRLPTAPAPAARTPDATWRRALTVSVVGAAVGSLSAVVLATESDREARGLSALGLVAGAATFSVGPAFLLRESAPESEEPAFTPAMQASIRF